MIIPLVLFVVCCLSCSGNDSVDTSSISTNNQGGNGPAGASGAAGIGGAGGSEAGQGGTSCFRGAVQFCGTEDCDIPCEDSGICWPVGADENELALGICPSDYSLGLNGNHGDCGAGCPSTKCCTKPFKENKSLVCTAMEVCDELIARKNENFATYTDYTPFTGELPQDPDSCLQPEIKWSTCSPQCGSCAKGYVCSGRSPTHPLGLCFPNYEISSENLPNLCTEGCLEGQLCFVWSTPGEPYQAMAKNTARCLPEEACLSIAKYLPGGAACLWNWELVAGTLASSAP